MLNAISNLRGYKCEICGIKEWNGKPIRLEIHHIDGDRTNNNMDNLQILCPNCHSQTENFRGKNINKEKTVTDEELVDALNQCCSVRQALIKVGLCGSGGNYIRANELIIKHQIAKYIGAPDEETV